MKETEKLKHIARELNNNVFAMLPTVETLVDVEVLLGHLREDMDAVVHQGEICEGYYREHHRMVRVLSELIRYTVKDLADQYERIEETQEKNFNMIVRNECETKENPLAGNEKAFNKIAN